MLVIKKTSLRKWENGRLLRRREEIRRVKGNWYKEQGKEVCLYGCEGGGVEDGGWK
jgi:hypothetical protein